MSTTVRIQLVMLTVLLAGACRLGAPTETAAPTASPSASSPATVEPTDAPSSSSQPSPSSPASPSASVPVSPAPTGDSGAVEDAVLGRWALVEMAGAPIPPDADIWLTFDVGERFNGYTGCNSYFGHYRAKGTSFQLLGTGMTLKGCGSETIRDREQAFTEAMGAVGRWRREPEHLVLEDGPTPRLTFKWTGAPWLGLIEWRLVRLDGEPVPDGAGITLVMRADGQATGSTGCDRYASEFERGDVFQHPYALLFREMSGSPTACPGAKGDRHASFVAALSEVGSFELAEDQLTLKAGRRDLLVFEAPD